MDILEVLNIIEENEKIQNDTINMVPSENNMSFISRLPLLFDLSNRYFFNDSLDDTSWNFRGAQNVSLLETDIAIPLVKKNCKSKYANIRPVSGLSGMALVLNALGGGANSNILTVSPEQGGHYATKDLASSFGLHVEFLSGIDEHTFDFKQIEKQVATKRFNLVYIDQSHCLFPIDIQKLSQSIKKVSPNTIIHVDISHFLGLVLGGAMQNPLEAGADSFGGSTHKTFPGPQRAIVCTNRYDISKKLKEAQFYMISSHHFGTVASLAIALMEFESCGEQYAKQILKNAKILAEALDGFGFDVKGKKYGYTNCHQVWMDTATKGVDSYTASQNLYQCGIRVNVLDDLPNTTQPTLRIGVNEITKAGAAEKDIVELASIMASAILKNESEDVLKEKTRKLKSTLVTSFGFQKNPDVCKKIIEMLYNLYNIRT